MAGYKPSMEMRCLDCICAGCKIEHICEEKGCDENVSVMECTNVRWECETYDDIETGNMHLC